MSFLKLCQISNENYVEDCDSQVILNNLIQYPLILQCEVINWESEEEFNKRGKASNFFSEGIIINEQPSEIREAVYQQLLSKYQELIK